MNNKRYSLGLYEKAFPMGKSFGEMLEETGKLGFDRLEISIDESDARLARLEWSDAEKHALVRSMQESGVPIKTMCLSGHRKYPFGASNPAVRERSMDIMKKAIDFAAQTGIAVIQLAGYDVYYEKGTEESKRLFLENLQKATALAARSGVVLAFETMETPFMDTVEKSMYYVEVVNSPWLGVYPDIGNLENAAVLYGHDVIDDLRKGQGHIFAMHLKETVPGVYRDMRFGSGGHTRYEDCLKLAAETGIAMFTGEFWYQKGQNYEEEIRHSAAFLREKLDKAFGQA